MALILPKPTPGTIRIKRYLDAVEAEAVCLRCEKTIFLKAGFHPEHKTASDEVIKRLVLVMLEDKHRSCDATESIPDDGAIAQAYREGKKNGYYDLEAELTKNVT